MKFLKNKNNIHAHINFFIFLPKKLNALDDKMPEICYNLLKIINQNTILWIMLF